MTCLRLAHLAPFAKGQKRICFVHPHDPAKCVKVPGEGWKMRARRKRWRSLFLPWSLPDFGRREFNECRRLRGAGEKIRRHIPRHFGFVNTDLGPGVVVELIRNADGAIAPTLDERIKQGEIPDALEEFRACLREGLLWNWNDPQPANVLCARGADGRERLYIVDGLEEREFIPLARLLPRHFSRSRAARKARLFERRIAALFAPPASGGRG